MLMHSSSYIDLMGLKRVNIINGSCQLLFLFSIVDESEEVDKVILGSPVRDVLIWSYLMLNVCCCCFIELI